MHTSGSAGSADSPREHQHQVTLRVVALYEAAKAGGALVVGLGALYFLRGDAGGAVGEWLAHLGLAQDSGLSEFLVHSVRHLESMGGRNVLGLLLLYAGLRLLVARGLWTHSAWGEWLGAVSGAIYIPIEIHALLRHAGWLPALTLAANLSIVGYLCLCLWWRRSAARRNGHD